METLRPTYRLLIGIPGKSNAFAISKRLGLQDYIIDSAREFISHDEARFEDVNTDLEISKKSVAFEQERAEQYRRNMQPRLPHEGEQAQCFQRNSFTTGVGTGNEQCGKFFAQINIDGHNSFLIQQRMSALRATSARLSISHESGLALAFCVLE